MVSCKVTELSVAPAGVSSNNTHQLLKHGRNIVFVTFKISRIKLLQVS